MNEYEIAELIIVLVLMVFAIYITHIYFEDSLEVFLTIFGMLVGVASILQVLNDFYYTLVIIMFVFLVYRLINRRNE